MKNKSRLLASLLTVLVFLLVLTNSCKKDDNKIIDLSKVPKTVMDIDSNIYHTVIIGLQVWMVENLRVTHFRNGDSIPNIIDNTEWAYAGGAYCNYNHDVKNSILYGRLYNWAAVSNSRKIAPIGWHVASDAEWSILLNYLGGAEIAGGKLKDTVTIHWLSPNVGATNEKGFTALPAGMRNHMGGGFEALGKMGGWWTSTGDFYYASVYSILNENTKLVRNYGGLKASGFSVRCIMDN
jgi:uncharacterized protein (TIGR02145 family)